MCISIIHCTNLFSATHTSVGSEMTLLHTDILLKLPLGIMCSAVSDNLQGPAIISILKISGKNDKDERNKWMLTQEKLFREQFRREQTP